MRIALYGAMVNSLYTIAKILRRNRYDADYIIEDIDTFPAHYPFWLDKNIQMTETDLHELNKSPQKFCEKIGWEAPTWVKALPETTRRVGLRELKHIKNIFIRFIFWIYQRHCKYLWQTFFLFQTYECIIVCGTNALIAARISGKPYIVWVYGADLRVYHDIEPKPKIGFGRIHYWMHQKLVKDTIDNADAIVSNPPFRLYSCGATNVTGICRDFSHYNVHEIVYPILQYEDKESLTVVDNSKINILIPSRVDFYWKGQDIFFRSFKKFSNKEKFHIYLLEWGNSQTEAQILVTELHLQNYVTFLPFFATRPALLNLYDKFDLIIDDFCFGSYGSIVQEAFSRKKPVLAYMDTKQFNDQKHIPPTINAKSEADILQVLEKIASQTIDLKKIGQLSATWQENAAGDKAFIQNIEKVFMSSPRLCQTS